MLEMDPKDALDIVDDELLSPPLFGFPAEDGSNSDSSRTSSQHSESPRTDWALPGWSQDKMQDIKSLDDLSTFSMDWKGLDMDADMSSFICDPPQLSIDPNALFQFTLPVPDAAPQPLQLPTPNETSSRSASPVCDSSVGVNPSDLSLFTQLGQKARDSAGVTLAIPAEQSQASIPSVSQTPITPPKVPIPRLRTSTGTVAPHAAQIFPDVMRAVSHPTPPVSITAPSPPPPAPGKNGRPKTSHTTIERRYRTNLNARILALRRAVPALRILEKNSSSQTQGKGLTGATAPNWDFDDVINERGYVDGVKAAKKNSKGVVLGKAVEYIRALKRREARLQREADGLRALLIGLVGGRELLNEWEREWRVRFGGEEADEVDEDEGDADIDVDIDEGAGEEESDEDDGRARKRARTTKAVTSPAEKRKRGRPRKKPPPTPVPDVPRASPTITAVSTPASKPLLALALVFSFFRPGTSPTSHSGAVLTPVVTSVSPEVEWSALQVLHVLVSVLLLVSLGSAYLPRSVTRYLPDALIFTPPPTPVSLAPGSSSSAIREERMLREALGAKGGISGVVRAALMPILSLRLRGDIRAWRRIAELDAVRGSDAPLLSRIQTYLTLTAQASRAPTDSITLALLARAFSRSSAVGHWEKARRAVNSTASEKLVLDMDMDEAASLLAVVASSSGSSSSSNSSDCEDEEELSPVRLIATQAVLTRAKTLAAHTFLSTVNPTSMDNSSDDTATAVCAAGRELGGEPALVTSLLERVANSFLVPNDLFTETDLTSDDGDAGAVRAFLRATILYRQVFPDAAVTLPPSPGRKATALRLELRRTLANAAFDANIETEEARDYVVDMLRQEQLN